MEELGWEQCDVILVTGDAYIDSPYTGAAVIGRVLMDAGYKVGVIAQPDTNLKLKAESLKLNGEVQDRPDDITRLGEPRLFWGVTGGCVDSMVSNYTATKKFRKSDDFTPGGQNTKRPDRAVIAYSNLIRQAFKNTVPIVLGGIEASLRRIAHYDYWSDNIRKSVLFDAKADFLVYGMGERAVVDLAGVIENRFQVSGFKFQEKENGQELRAIRGICYVSPEKPEGYLEIPSFDEVKYDKKRFIEAFKAFYKNNDFLSAKGLVQRQDTRYLVQNPPAEPLKPHELDRVNELPYERDAHPYYKSQGVIKALDTIRFSVNSHRGCYGECNFCAITNHQGRVVISRSENSILKEAELLTKLPGFTGYIYDIGGPTANMYATGCSKVKDGHCESRRCLFPEVCPSLINSHQRQIKLLERVRKIKGIKKVFIGSGIRYDMVMADKNNGSNYLKILAQNHTSGQIKLAPEHSDAGVLKLMGKPGTKSLVEFKDAFFKYSAEAGLKQFITYYLIAAHPGCSEREMHSLKGYLSRELKARPEQVQVFTPTPGTWSSVMYYTGIDPFTGGGIFVEKGQKGKENQKEIIKTQEEHKGGFVRKPYFKNKKGRPDY